MTTIEMKIAKNGNIIVKTNDGIETSRKFADAVAALADTTFTGKPDVEIIVDRNDDSHICDTYIGGFDFNQSSYIFTDNNGNEYSFWDSHLALKQFARGIFGEAITVKPAVTESNPDDYAVTEDAFQVAVNAEIQNANNVKINDLKWEIRYTEGSIVDLDKNHIAHFPQDQSLQERRVELVNELDNLNAQLAELLPTEPNTNSEYKYYLQSRRPIAGAVPNGYISATQGEMKVHSLRSDGSISPVPRKVVFGVVVYDHPLSDQQIINYDLHVDPLNPKVEPATTELSDIEPDNEPDEPKFQTGKSYYIKDGDSYYILKVEARTDKMLTGTTPHGTCKYHIHDTFKGEYIRTHLYDDCGNREMIWAANEYTPQVDPIIQERETARNEYDQLNAARKVIEKDVEKFERLRGRCKPNSPKHKEYKQLLESFDPIIRAFGQKFIAAQDRYNQSLTLRTDEEKAATQKAIDEHNADLDARGIKYFATVYYYPNGIEGEDMETFCKECTSLDEANAFVSQDDHDGVYVGGIYDAGWEITDRNGNIVADHITGIKMTNTTQAGFLKDKINRESKSIDDSTTDRDEVFNLLPDLDQLNDLSETDPYFMDDDAEYTERDARFNYGERYAAALTEKLSQYDPTVEVTYDIDYDDEDVYYLKFDGIYRSRYTLSGIESAFHSLKKDIAEEEFMKSVDGTLDDKIAALERKQARDSLNRAIKQCIRNRIGYLKSHNSKMEKYEYELMHLLQGARRELEVA